MKGDFSRTTFNKKNHYTGVRMQQGRVQLDADWNEQIDIQAYRTRMALRDLIGAAGGADEAGFEITLDNGKISIGPGHYYVEGWLCENEVKLSIDKQSDFLGFSLPTEDGRYLVYLDAWERHITALDASELLEPALGGPDTTTRTKLVWQVKLEKGNQRINNCDDAWKVLQSKKKTGGLAARTQPPEVPKDDCILPDKGGYVGRENQLYRVEIHNGGDYSAATYKWSRENGSVVSKLMASSSIDNKHLKLTLETPGLDKPLGFAVGDYVELLDDHKELLSEPGLLLQVKSSDGNEIIGESVEGTIPTDHWTKVRRWEGYDTLQNGTNWIKLENGIEVQFDQSQYRSGDYWLIPARIAAGKDSSQLLWPGEIGNGFLEPNGIKHYYAPLALLDNAKTIWRKVEDCRRIFEIGGGASKPRDPVPVSQVSCCTVTVGEGGEFPDLQAALDSDELLDGGRVCLLAGEHKLKESVSIKALKKSIAIVGCGKNQTVLIAPIGKAALVIQGAAVQLQGLTVKSDGQAGTVIFLNAFECAINECIIESGQFGGGVAIAATFSKNLTIEGNIIKGGVIGQFQQTSFRRNKLYQRGLHILEGSSDVTIKGNTIGVNSALENIGSGIALGGLGLPENNEFFTNDVDKIELSLRDSFSGVSQITIIDNDIQGMDNSGIASPAELQSDSTLGEISDIQISRNRITKCAREVPNERYHKKAVGGIVLTTVSGLRITDNYINANGSEDSQVACGIFIDDCMNVDIHHNIVTNNGILSPDPAKLIYYQAGIIVSNVSSFLNEEAEVTFRLHDNKIICPQGHALIVLAYGPVSVQSNSFVTKERRDQPSSLIFGECVFIINLGHLYDPESWRGRVVQITEDNPSDGGKILFNNNQIQLDVRLTTSVLSSTIVIFTNDDLVIMGNQISTWIFNKLRIQEAAMYSDAFSSRIVGNQFSELSGTAELSCFAAAYKNVVRDNLLTHPIEVYDYNNDSINENLSPLFE